MSSRYNFNATKVSLGSMKLLSSNKIHNIDLLKNLQYNLDKDKLNEIKLKSSKKIVFETKRIQKIKSWRL